MSFVPGSRTSYSSGSTSSYRSITPTTPKPPPPPTVQPIISALKQPSSSRGGRKDDPRFGPKLDPREELMIAIRSAGGRTALNKVRLRLQNLELLFTRIANVTGAFDLFGVTMSPYLKTLTVRVNEALLLLLIKLIQTGNQCCFALVYVNIVTEIIREAFGKPLCR